MKLSRAGKALIQSYESCRLEAYPDPGSLDGKPWTIGWGHTVGVNKGDVCTQEQADQWFEEDISIYEKGITRLVTAKLSQNKFDSLVSFVYNIGLGAFEKSTLLRLLNESNYMGASEQFKRWVLGSNGKPLLGLIRRREAERKLFMEGVNYA